MLSARFLKYTTLFSSMLLLSSCMGREVWLRDRGNDLADIATVEVSSQSYGVALRAGPIKFGGSWKSPNGYAAGLRGGAFGEYRTTEFTALFFGADYFYAPIEAGERPKLRARNKEFLARSPLGTEKPLQKTEQVLKTGDGLTTGYYYTQLELSLGLYYGVKLGLNFGEMVDFIVGLVGLSLFDDNSPHSGRSATQAGYPPIFLPEDALETFRAAD